MDPMRVLQVVTVMNRGGLETMLMNYYRKIDRSRIQFDFMVHRPEKGHYDDEIFAMGGKIFRMPKIRPGNYRLYFNQLDQFFKKYKEYQIVHAHLNENSGFVLRSAKKAGIPCRIAHSHLSDLIVDYKLPFRIYARRAMQGHPSHYFACSQKAGEWLYGQKATDNLSVTILNNAINVEKFTLDPVSRAHTRRELQVNDGLVIGHIGRFNKQKNHDFVLDIFKEVHRKRSDSILVLIGDGPLRGKIEKKAKKLNLMNNIRFLGVRSDISDLLHSMDLFLFPSLFEGLPVCMVEAQAAGLTCIISDSITKEVDISGRVQFLGLNQSAEAWADHILSSSYEHVDSSGMLKKNGYDTATMALWLSDFYTSQSTKQNIT